MLSVFLDFIINWFLQDDEGINSKTMVAGDAGTLVPYRDAIDSGTMIEMDSGTLVPGECGTMVELQSDLGTMVINSDTEDESTMKSEL